MRLGNPFLNGPSLHPTSIRTPNQDIYNPGPGLPQATIPTYNYTLPPPPSSFLNGRDRFSRTQNGSGGSQNNPFFCDRCDRSFRSQELLNVHISEHITCGIEGCSFVAHPKIVEMHVQMQHKTGLASMIMNLTTPEEIRKWREERKKNFPSSSNIARRQAEQKEKLDRGEVLYEPKTRFERKGKRNRREQNRNGKGRTDKCTDSTSSEVTPNLARKDHVFSQSEIDSSRKIIPTECKLPKEEKELSDGEICSETETECKSAVNNLSNFMNCYLSEGEEAPEAKKIKAEPIVGDQTKEKKNKSRSQQNRKKNKTRRPQNQKEKDRDEKRSQGALQSIHPKRLTLLQKLLEKEIIHERNVVLQCVHYIVQQNFFGIGQKANDKIPLATHQSCNTSSRCAYFI